MTQLNVIPLPKTVAGYAFYMSIISGVIVAAIALLFVNPIVHLLGADASTLLYTKHYNHTFCRWLCIYFKLCIRTNSAFGRCSKRIDVWNVY